MFSVTALLVCVKRYALGRLLCFCGFLACLRGAGSLPPVWQTRQRTHFLAAGPSAPCSPRLVLRTAGSFLGFRSVQMSLL